MPLPSTGEAAACRALESRAAEQNSPDSPELMARSLDDFLVLEHGAPEFVLLLFY